jgi:hypothetical protein
MIDEAGWNDFIYLRDFRNTVECLDFPIARHQRTAQMQCRSGNNPIGISGTVARSTC